MWCDINCVYSKSVSLLKLLRPAISRLRYLDSDMPPQKNSCFRPFLLRQAGKKLERFSGRNRISGWEYKEGKKKMAGLKGREKHIWRIVLFRDFFGGGHSGISPSFLQSQTKSANTRH